MGRKKRQDEGDGVTATIQIGDGDPVPFDPKRAAEASAIAAREAIERRELSKEDLPKPLRRHFPDLQKALKAAHPATWPEDEKYVNAGVPAAVAGVLIGDEDLHSRLVNARIRYLWKKDMKSKGYTRLGVASKANAKLAYLANIDFLIVFNWTAWADVSPKQRLAIVDHELCHCDRDLDSGKWIIRRHDVEEFSEIVERWGLWKSDLQLFGQAIQLQLEL